MVCRVILGSVDSVEGPLAGEEERERSKPVCEECSQKFDLDPFTALLCRSVGIVEDGAMAILDYKWRAFAGV